MSKWFAVAFFLTASACAGSSHTGTPSAAAPKAGAHAGPGETPVSKSVAMATAGVTDTGLRALLADHWEWTLERAPMRATNAGDHRFDDRLADVSHAALMAARSERARFLERARALRADGMSRADQIHLALFVHELERAEASDVCDFHLWSVSARSNQPFAHNRLPELHPIRNLKDAENLLARYRQIAGNIDAELANFTRGLEAGLVANADSVGRVLAQLDGELAKQPAEWPLYNGTEAVLKAAREGVLDAADAEKIHAELRSVVTAAIHPAWVRYRTFLADRLLPSARGASAEGVGALPQGKRCYDARIHSYTGLPLQADDLHDIGLREIARINQEMRELGGKLFGTRDLKQIIKRLRTDRSLYFERGEEILEAAREAVAAANAKVPDYFGIKAQAEVVVVEIPEYEAPFTTIAYYWPAKIDGSKPGEYFINTYRPEIRPRFEMQVLAFHEAVPGHHFQIAIAQERGALPAFRRFGGSTAFVEGWALYTERLSEEMGLYSGDLDRMGMLSYDAWRASRLVVDTGVHSKGWTRRQAEEYMLAHTALTPQNIENEVDRYISWPGQALAYKVGQLEILRLRQQAEAALGEQFNLASFHDVVLKNGAVTLPVLRAEVERWVAETTSNQ